MPIKFDAPVEVYEWGKTEPLHLDPTNKRPPTLRELARIALETQLPGDEKQGLEEKLQRGRAIKAIEQTPAETVDLYDGYLTLLKDRIGRCFGQPGLVLKAVEALEGEVK